MQYPSLVFGSTSQHIAPSSQSSIPMRFPSPVRDMARPPRLGSPRGGSNAWRTPMLHHQGPRHALLTDGTILEDDAARVDALVEVVSRVAAGIVVFCRGPRSRGARHRLRRSAAIRVDGLVAGLGRSTSASMGAEQRHAAPEGSQRDRHMDSRALHDACSLSRARSPRQRARTDVLVALRRTTFLVPRLACLAAGGSRALEVASRIGDVAQLGAAARRSLAGPSAGHRARIQTQQAGIAGADEFAGIAVGSRGSRSIARTRPLRPDEIAALVFEATVLQQGVAPRQAQEKGAIRLDMAEPVGLALRVALVSLTKGPPPSGSFRKAMPVEPRLVVPSASSVGPVLLVSELPAC